MGISRQREDSGRCAGEELLVLLRCGEASCAGTQGLGLRSC